jgi:alpha-1,4-digalacturonate transport system substrate-binding protein
MKKLLLCAVVFMLMFAVSSVGFTAEPVELRFIWYDDGEESAVIREQLDRFEAENPDIKVVMDIVAYKTILEQLPIQVEAGKGPDLGRITNMAVMACEYLDLRPYLKDAQYFEDNFPPASLQVFRCGDDTEALHGFPMQFTVTGPYINRTLFEQAGIEVPSDAKENVTWEEWTEVTQQVAEVTETPYAIAIDRSGHRVAGPALSMGASFFDADGNWTIDSEGFRAFANIVKGWHDAGITPKEVWIGSGDSYAQAGDYFINAELVMYMSGSWNIGRFTNDIGDAFDWDVVPNPSGPGGSTGLPGGASIAAFKSTEHPEEVARVMEYLIQEDVVAEFSAKTLFIPGQLAVADKGVEYATDLPAARSSLNGYLSEIPKLQNEAFQILYNPVARVYYGESVNRLTQWMIGELSLDEAIERVQQALDEAIANK